VKKAVLTHVAVGIGALAMAAGSATAAPPSLPKPQVTGYQMVNRFLSHLQTGNAVKLNALLAPSFVVQRANGTWATKPVYMRNLPRIESYDITSAFSTYSLGTLTVRWQVATSETLPGVPVGTAPAPRLSTFTWTPSGFRLTAHANFNPPA
jgi:hypothetical protein